MKPDFPQSPQDAREARLTALLLGELTSAEAAEVRTALAQDAELSRLYERLKQTVDLVRTATASADEKASPQPVPLRMSAEKREKLLQQFRVITPRDLSGHQHRRFRWVIPASLAAAVMGLLTLISMMIPWLVGSKQSAFEVASHRGKAFAQHGWFYSKAAAPSASAEHMNRPELLGRLDEAASASKQDFAKLDSKAGNATAAYGRAAPGGRPQGGTVQLGQALVQPNRHDGDKDLDVAAKLAMPAAVFTPARPAVSSPLYLPPNPADEQPPEAAGVSERGRTRFSEAVGQTDDWSRASDGRGRQEFGGFGVTTGSGAPQTWGVPADSLGTIADLSGEAARPGQVATKYANNGNGTFSLAADYQSEGQGKPEQKARTEASRQAGAVTAVTGLGNAVAVPSGSEHSLALKADGGVASWWGNAAGRPVALQNSTEQRQVASSQFSPDGFRVISVPSDKMARVWDASTEKPRTAPLPVKLPAPSLKGIPDDLPKGPNIESLHETLWADNAQQRGYFFDTSITPAKGRQARQAGDLVLPGAGGGMGGMGGGHATTATPLDKNNVVLNYAYTADPADRVTLSDGLSPVADPAEGRSSTLETLALKARPALLPADSKKAVAAGELRDLVENEKVNVAAGTQLGSHKLIPMPTAVTTVGPAAGEAAGLPALGEVPVAGRYFRGGVAKAPAEATPAASTPAVQPPPPAAALPAPAFGLGFVAAGDHLADSRKPAISTPDAAHPIGMDGFEAPSTERYGGVLAVNSTMAGAKPVGQVAEGLEQSLARSTSSRVKELKPTAEGEPQHSETDALRWVEAKTAAKPAEPEVRRRGLNQSPGTSGVTELAKRLAAEPDQQLVSERAVAASVSGGGKAAGKRVQIALPESRVEATKEYYEAATGLETSPATVDLFAGHYRAPAPASGPAAASAVGGRSEVAQSKPLAPDGKPASLPAVRTADQPGKDSPPQPIPNTAKQVGEARSAELKRDIVTLQELRGKLATQVAAAEVDAQIPRSTVVDIVDHANGQQANKPTLFGRLRETLTGQVEQTARIQTTRDASEPSVTGLADRSSVTASYDPYWIQSEVESIKSKAVLNKVIENLNLTEAWAGKYGASEKPTPEETFQRLKGMIDVRPSPNTELLDIRVRSDKSSEAAQIANTIAKVYIDVRNQKRREISERGGEIVKKQLADQDRKIASAREELERLQKDLSSPQPDAQLARPASTAPIPQPEVRTAENPFSTFSLNVSDVSFKLANASLEKGLMPDPSTVRSEEFINAFDYRDPEPPPGVPIGFAWERVRYPFAHNRDLLRFSVKTAALGREAGRPLNLVLVIDNSGSMERADRVQIIRQCLRVLLDTLQPQDKISVVTFARTPRLWVDGQPAGQVGDLDDRLGALTPEGGTNLEEAMNLAYATAARHYLAGGVNRVVLLTDGAANLGDVDPDALKRKVEAGRKQGIALDCFGIGWEGYNDDLLEVLSRNGDGRYGFVNTPDEAATEFAGQLAGALQVAASDVKVQVEFNPRRVTAYRQIGYAKHQLKKEQFRDNTVDAAEIGAAEAGNALYVVEVAPQGEGPLGIVRVRFKVPGTSDYREHEWTVPYSGTAPALQQASPAMRLAAAASAFSEWLVSSPFAAEVTPDALLGYLGGVPEIYGADKRPTKLEWMIRQAKAIAGR
jgi:anti-sigma factor RsiW/uncharacterized protein YegL